MDEIPEIKFLAGHASSEISPILGKLYKPYPAAEAMPDWYKDLPLQYFSDRTGGDQATVKTCPGVFDMLRAGYIIPAWHDMVIKYDPDAGGYDDIQYAVPQAINKYSSEMRFHESLQLKGCPMTEGKHRPWDKFVKFSTPWYIEAPEGISIMYMHPFYRQSHDFFVLPGMVDPHINDISNKEINVFLQLHVPNQDIWIEAGEPLIQVIPFRREDYKFTVDYLDTKEKLEQYKLLEYKRATKLAFGKENKQKSLLKLRNKDNKNYNA